jgi:hypothetical protein
LNKTVIKNATDILSNIATKISHPLTTNNSKNVGVVTTAPKASKDRKTLQLRYLYRYNRTVGGDKCTEIFKSRCIERSTAPFPLIEEILKRHFKLQSQMIIALL